MVDILRTAVSGLMASRTAMATTSHNVANVNTPYYSRQRVELGTPMPEQRSYGYLGRGVEIQGITRAYDEFLMKQLRGHGSGVGQYDTLNNLTGQMSALLGDTEVGLTPNLEKFFGALQDLANSPASIPARQVFLDEARTLTTRVQDIDGALGGLRKSVDTGIRNAVATINDLTAGVAKLNQDIAATQSPANAPNDLLDNRDRLLMDLSKLVGIQVVTQDDGGVNVFMGNGQPLVVGNNAYQLEAAPSGFDPQEITVRLPGQAAGSDLERYIAGGELGGYFEFRRTILNPAQDGLGLLAMGLTETFNDQHAKGMNLDGETGVALFAARAPKVWTHGANQGDAAFSASLVDSTALARSDYEIRYDGANYSAVRLSDQKVLLASGDLAALNVELEKDGLALTPSSGAPQAGDRFLLQPTRQGGAGFELLVGDPRKVAAAAPITTSAATGNLGSGGISPGAVADSDNANLWNTVTIEFTAVDQFTVTDTVTGDSFTQAYDSVNGTTVSYNGWEVTLSGNPQAGDTFEVKDNIGGIGDNRNALELVKLELKPQLLGGNDYRGVYAQMIAEVGAQGRRVESTLRSQEALFEQSTMARESISGVNLDEEAANLVRFQQAYEASAQMIQTANSLFKTVLDAVRS
ncbi:MAG: flagellar hook-associated protein FlgK [Candidatus Competibacteraceae bacterium]|nr:MAG: flagellar hook-associated protein FlgK [Candidatus Competibacteraceae bacterium]